MGRVRFDPASVSFDDFHVGYPQDGSGIENTYYYAGIPTFQRGMGLSFYNQRGTGFADILRGIYRFLIPLAKKAGKAVAEEGLGVGERILQRVNQGEKLNIAALEEGKKGVDKILEKAGLPKPFQTGSGRKGIKRKQRSKIGTHPLVGRQIRMEPKRSRMRVDAFGQY